MAKIPAEPRTRKCCGDLAVEERKFMQQQQNTKPKPRRLTKAERRANARRNITECRIQWEQKQERLKQNQQL